MRDLLLDAVRELGAGIFGVIPCSCAWKQVQKRKVTPSTGGFQTAAKITFLLPSASVSFPAPHAWPPTRRADGGGRADAPDLQKSLPTVTNPVFLKLELQPQNTGGL